MMQPTCYTKEYTYIVEYTQHNIDRTNHCQKIMDFQLSYLIDDEEAISQANNLIHGKYAMWFTITSVTVVQVIHNYIKRIEVKPE